MSTTRAERTLRTTDVGSRFMLLLLLCFKKWLAVRLQPALLDSPNTTKLLTFEGHFLAETPGNNFFKTGSPGLEVDELKCTAEK